MSDQPLTVTPATTVDLTDVEALLEANDLPAQDVRTGPAQFFVAAVDDDLVGCGGLERHGTDGLLRSVVIAESARGQGYGHALCESLEDYARTDGVTTLHLLTTTAARFFRQHGYREVDREAVPARLRQTTQFSDLCPASATCLRKALR